MPLYEYTARTKDGKSVRGAVNADTEEMASAALADRGLFDVGLTERREELTVEAVWQRLFGLKRRDIVIFSRQLAVLVSADVPLVRALRVLEGQTASPRLRQIVRDVADDVESGSKLSDAMAAHRSFSEFMVNMVRSGETSGRLSEVLEYLADQEEKDYDLVAKIRGAMMYPAFIIFGLVVVGFIMVTWVLPKLTDVLKETGASLPLSTRILIGVSDFFASYWWLVIILAIGAAIAGRFAVHTPGGRFLWDGLKLRVPVFGALFKRMALVRFTRSMETLLEGGVDQVSAIGIAANVVGNRVYKEVLLLTQKEVEDGNSITAVMVGHPDVPAMLSQMLAVGEETGKLVDVLKRLTSFYTREIDNLLGSLVTLIEPMIMVVMGIGVGIMVSAVILPMYSLANSF